MTSSCSPFRSLSFTAKSLKNLQIIYIRPLHSPRKQILPIHFRFTISPITKHFPVKTPSSRDHATQGPLHFLWGYRLGVRPPSSLSLPPTSQLTQHHCSLAAELYPLPYESDRPIQNRIRRDCTSTQLSPCRYLHRGSYRTATAYSETATSTKKLDCGGCAAVAIEQEHCPERGWVCAYFACDGEQMAYDDDRL